MNVRLTPPPIDSREAILAAAVIEFGEPPALTGVRRIRSSAVPWHHRINVQLDASGPVQAYRVV